VIDDIDNAQNRKVTMTVQQVIGIKAYAKIRVCDLHTGGNEAKDICYVVKLVS